MLGLVVLAALLCTVAPFASRSSHAAPPPGPPNIVFILTDDQRFDALDKMPQVQNAITDHGVKFTNAVVDNPWCCPSRASFLTGQRSHTTHVWNSTPRYGGFASFQDSSTIATWLHDAGYRTGLVGKYLNGYENDPTYVPPGWDTWDALTYNTYAYLNYKVSEKGVERYYGTTAADYKTDVLGNYADSFIRNTPPNEPLFLYFTPNAPHGPATPAAKYARTDLGLAPWSPPSYNEADMSDKPAYMRALAPLTSTYNPQKFRTNQYKTLLSVDDAVGKITQALQDTGRLDNTVLVFASDNGLLWGEHRVKGTSGDKVVPYIESLRIPLIIRYDALTTQRTDNHLVVNIDLAPTLAGLAGIAAPGAEGQSLVPFLSGRDQPWRTDSLIEHVRGGGNAFEKTVPTYCGVHNDKYTYVVYATGERELYNEQADPYELTNVVNDPAYSAVVNEMHARLVDLCQPVPPGMTLSPSPG